MQINKEQPIGIFDSGIGGLTVAHAIRTLMPEESLLYFGDTAHLPYGDKSEAAIQAYSVKIADVLLRRQCKVIVIACNSASSAAYNLLKEYVHRSVEVINVIDPMVDLVVGKFANQSVGLIGTRRTIQSGIYAEKINARQAGITLKSLATPLLVPMIEEGFFNNQISDKIIHEYLDDPHLKGIEALVLGCTHYPLVKEEIASFFSKRIAVLDSSEVVAQSLRDYLRQAGLLNVKRSAPDHFLVSDYTESFEASTKQFFRESVHLEKYALWG
ncbi:MAG: glutamate racemase [Cyclobacteriaceae bacterium]|nr:glutamate racemase [Cyclobacteriaceae bacterium]